MDQNKILRTLRRLDQSFFDNLIFLKARGQFQPSRYFSGDTVSPFSGISYAPNQKYLLKVEYDTTLTSGKIEYEEPRQEFSFGIDFNLTKNLTIGISSERGNATSIKFSYRNNTKISKPR